MWIITKCSGSFSGSSFILCYDQLVHAVHGKVASHNQFFTYKKYLYIFTKYEEKQRKQAKEGEAGGIKGNKDGKSE